MCRVTFAASSLASAALALALFGVANRAAAHHPPRFESCQSTSFAGQIDRIEWGNPHVEIVIRSDDGESYRMTWLNLQALHRAGIQIDTLSIGDEVTVEGGIRDNDVIPKPIWLSHIHRASDGWDWAQPFQGC